MFWDDRRAALFLLAAMLLTFAICMALHAGSLPERLPSGLFGGLGMALLVFSGLVWVMARGKRQSLQEAVTGIGGTALGAGLLLQESVIFLIIAVLLAFAVPYALERWAPEQWRIAAPH